MSQPVLVKVYGNFTPASLEFAEKLSSCGPFASAMADAGDVVALEGSLLLIFFEGVWFPVDEVVDRVRQWLAETRNAAGKLDVLDIEEWKLSRYLVQNGKLLLKQAPLNNVLDYSGH